TEVIDTNAVHVTADNNIALFFSEEASGPRNDNACIMPNVLLGNDYFIMSYGFSSTSEFVIITPGITDTLDITPSVATDGGHPAGITYTVVINPGQDYQVQCSTGDLTGSRVRSRNPSQTFAVIGANSLGSVYCAGTVDPLFDELLPVNDW